MCLAASPEFRAGQSRVSLCLGDLRLEMEPRPGRSAHSRRVPGIGIWSEPSMMTSRAPGMRSARLFAVRHRIYLVATQLELSAWVRVFAPPKSIHVDLLKTHKLKACKIFRCRRLLPSPRRRTVPLYLACARTSTKRRKQFTNRTLLPHPFDYQRGKPQLRRFSHLIRGESSDWGCCRRSPAYRAMRVMRSGCRAAYAIDHFDSHAEMPYSANLSSLSVSTTASRSRCRASNRVVLQPSIRHSGAASVILNDGMAAPTRGFRNAEL